MLFGFDRMSEQKCYLFSVMFLLPLFSFLQSSSLWSDIVIDVRVVTAIVPGCSSSVSLWSNSCPSVIDIHVVRAVVPCSPLLMRLRCIHCMGMLLHQPRWQNGTRRTSCCRSSPKTLIRPEQYLKHFALLVPGWLIWQMAQVAVCWRGTWHVRRGG